VQSPNKDLEGETERERERERENREGEQEYFGMSSQELLNLEVSDRGQPSKQVKKSWHGGVLL
jgi:hypothetical protein